MLTHHLRDGGMDEVGISIDAAVHHVRWGIQLGGKELPIRCVRCTYALNRKVTRLEPEAIYPCVLAYSTCGHSPAEQGEGPVFEARGDGLWIP
jgi:hypothetical protein